jgi:hypothetical protein
LASSASIADLTVEGGGGGGEGGRIEAKQFDAGLRFSVIRFVNTHAARSSVKLASMFSRSRSRPPPKKAGVGSGVPANTTESNLSVVDQGA